MGLPHRIVLDKRRILCVCGPFDSLISFVFMGGFSLTGRGFMLHVIIVVYNYHDFFSIRIEIGECEI